MYTQKVVAIYLVNVVQTVLTISSQNFLVFIDMF